MEKNTKTLGNRFNDEKLPYDLIPPIVEEALAKVLAFGCKKYARRNWEKGMSYSTSYNSLMRHLRAWYQGEEFDEESDLNHTWHILWNVMAIVEMERRLKNRDSRLSILDIDDRPYLNPNSIVRGVKTPCFTEPNFPKPNLTESNISSASVEYTQAFNAGCQCPDCQCRQTAAQKNV